MDTSSSGSALSRFRETTRHHDPAFAIHRSKNPLDAATSRVRRTAGGDDHPVIGWGDVGSPHRSTTTIVVRIEPSPSCKPSKMSQVSWCAGHSYYPLFACLLISSCPFTSATTRFAQVAWTTRYVAKASIALLRALTKALNSVLKLISRLHRQPAI